MKKTLAITSGLFLLVMLGFYRGFYEAPTEIIQGEIYRIIYLHVPVAIASFFAALILFIFSITALRSKSLEHLMVQRAAAEVGLAFTVITLASGSIWGKPTWGTWWVWDARLTTTLLLALLYAGYLLLYNATSSGTGRLRACSLLGIIIFADIPIIYKSVDWWRTLHQGHTLFEPNKNPISPEIRTILVFCIVSMIIYAGWLIRLRYRAIKQKDILEALSYEAVR